MGNVVFEKPHLNSGENINLKSLPSGLYLSEYQSENKTKTQKLQLIK